MALAEIWNFSSQRKPALIPALFFSHDIHWLFLAVPGCYCTLFLAVFSRCYYAVNFDPQTRNNQVNQNDTKKDIIKNPYLQPVTA
jgi:hypothetical protein